MSDRSPYWRGVGVALLAVGCVSCAGLGADTGRHVRHLGRVRQKAMVSPSDLGAFSRNPVVTNGGSRCIS